MSTEPPLWVEGYCRETGEKCLLWGEHTAHMIVEMGVPLTVRQIRLWAENEAQLRDFERRFKQLGLAALDDLEPYMEKFQ
jgi:hypothetical protein